MKRILSVLILLALCTSLVACQPNPETPPVVSKNDGKLEEAIVNGAPDGYVYEAPESYSKAESYLDGKINITIDENTEIVAKVGIKYPVYEATITDFAPDTLRCIADVFFEGADMEQHLSRDERETKSYILNNYILPLQEEIANIENGTLNPTVDDEGNQIVMEDGFPATLEEELDSRTTLLEVFQRKYKNAPETVNATPVSLDSYKAGDSFNADIPLPDGRLGRLCVKGNVLTATYNHVEAADDDVNEYYGGVLGYVSLINSNDDLPPDDTLLSGITIRHHMAQGLDYNTAKTQASELVERLGLSDYIAVGVGISSYYSELVESTANMNYTYTKLGVVFTRKVGDSITVPDMYLTGYDEMSGMSEDSDENDAAIEYSEPFHYEKLIVWVNANGVEGIYWSAPLKIEREVQSSVELIDFEKVAQTAIDRAQRTAHDFADSGIQLLSGAIMNQDLLKRFNIYYCKFELGYAMIKEKNKNGYFILIPTWIATYNRDDEVYTDDTKTDTMSVAHTGASWTVAVNAIDGSCIDRSLGY